MPSTRDPVVVVQPGPGRLPANTVPANALIFPPGGGSDAALQAHITDPVGAHADSAISSTGYAGATWSDAAGSVRTALTRAYEGLNARSAWVLDANPANAADFTGPDALIDAVAAIVTGLRPQLYLRPGIYNWDDSALLSRTTVIGAVPHTSVGADQVRIQNLAGDLRLGAFTTLQNVHLDLSGELRLVGGFGIGFNTLSHVTLAVLGNIRVNCFGNVFRDVYQQGLDPSYIEDTAGFNSYENFSIGQMALSNAVPIRVDSFTIDGPPLYPALPLMSVASASNLFDRVLINGASGTGSALEVTEDNNHFTAVVIGGLTTTTVGEHTVDISGSLNTIDGLDIDTTDLSAGATSLLVVSGTANEINGMQAGGVVGGTAPLVSVTGDQNTINTIVVETGSVSSHIVNITSSYNTVKALKIDGVAVTGAFSALRLTEDGNRCEGVLLTNLTGFSEPLVYVDSTGALDPRNNTVTNVVIDSVSGQTDKFISIAGIGNQLQGYKLLNATGATSAASALSLSGQAHLAQNIYLADMSFAGIVVEFLNSDECTVENVNIDNVDAATTFRVTNFSSAECCTLRSGRLDSCGVLASTGALFNYSGSSNCVVDTWVVNASGGTTPLAAPVFDWTAGTCQNNILRNISITSLQNTEVEPLIDIDTTFAQGLLIERLNINSNAISHIRITGAAEDDELSVRVVGARLENNEITNASHNININACGVRVILEDVWSKSRDTDAYALSVVDSLLVSTRDSVFLGDRGASCNAINSGANFTRTRFVGGTGSAGSGVQLFRGHGHDGTTYEVTPLVLNDCEMEYSSSNCDPTTGTGSGEPVIFFGGSGGTVATDHGPFAINGLNIHPGSSVTNQHLDDLLVIECNSTVNTGLVSTFRDVTVDLQEITWSTSGAGRGTLSGLTDASVVAINDGSAQVTSPRPNCEVDGLRIIRVKEGTITDVRSLISAYGCILRNPVVDGPAAAGTGSFASPLVNLLGTVLAYDLRVGVFHPIACSTHVVSVQDNSSVSGGSVLYASTTIAPNSLVFMDSNFANYAHIEKLRIMLGTSVVTSQIPDDAFVFIESGADQCTFENNTIEFFGATNSDVPVIRVDSNTTRCALVRNRLVNGSGGTGLIGVAGAPGTGVDTIHVTSSIGVQVVDNIITIGNADAGGGATPPGAAIKLTTCTRCLVSGNDLNASAQPMLIWAIGGSGNRIVHNSLDNPAGSGSNNNTQIWLGDPLTPGSESDDNFVSGNLLVSTASLNNIVIVGDRNVVTGNNMDVTTSTIIIFAGSSDNNVLGNQNASLVDAGTNTWPDAAINSPATGNNG